MSNQIDLDFSNPNVAGYLNMRLFHEIDRGWQEFNVSSNSDTSIWPNVCVPVAAVIEHYRDMDIDIECSWDKENSYLSSTQTHKPWLVSEHLDFTKKKCKNPLSTVWKYVNSDEVQILVNSIRDEMTRRDILSNGVLQGIEWCLNEIMDNVLQHSQAECGYLMATYTPNSKWFSVCIFDNGIGVLNSLQGTEYHPRTSLDAITFAIKEGVTRDNSIGQGNGMWGLTKIVLQNGGRCHVASGGASLSYIGEETQSFEKDSGVFYSNMKLGTTLVDFQLDCSSEIDIAGVLNGHSPAMLWLEDLESPTGESIVFRIADESEGTGTRRAGLSSRNKLLNIMRESGKHIVIDFSNISIMSSSFADELIGKLLEYTGFTRFNDFFELANVSDLNQRIIDRSVQQRMAQLYYDENIPEED